MTWDLSNAVKESLGNIYISRIDLGILLWVVSRSFDAKRMSKLFQLRIYGAKYQIDGGQAEVALNSTVAMFDEYEALFGMNYSLPKYGGYKYSGLVRLVNVLERIYGLMHDTFLIWRLVCTWTN